MDDSTSAGIGVSLRGLLPDADFAGARDIRVVSCCADSRQCRAGDLFVALPGTTDDGHRHIEQAIERGARAVLVERPLAGAQVPACIVPDTRTAYGLLCLALAGNPQRDLKLIGMTGTNGKTTTSLLVASVLSSAGFATGLIGTLGCCDGVDFGPARLTTPSPPELANWLARMVANGCSHAVVEVSSHALSQARVAGLEFDVAAVTNVAHDHLDYHESVDAYRTAKRRIFDHLSDEGMAVLNADDDVCTRYLTQIDSPALSVGVERPAEISGAPIEQLISEQTFLLSAGDETVPVRTPLVGSHNVSNCLVATAVGLAYGIDLPTIVRGLEDVDKVPGRLERIECGQPFSVFVDYAHTAEALDCVLDTLRGLTSGRVICVFGAGGDRDRRKRPAMGRAAERRADVCILTSDNPRHEDPRQIAVDVLRGFREPDVVRVLFERAEAIGTALELARPGDCVLIAGKGHEDYQLVGDERRYFDDRAFAREWLYEQQNAAPTSRAA